MEPKRSYTSGQFIMELDGHKSAGYIRSVSGGTVKAKVVENTLGPSSLAHKNLGALEIEPIAIELGAGMSRDVLEWIQASWRGDFERRDGAIYHADDKYKSQFEQSFSEALITEVTFPTLDGGLKADKAAYIKVTLHPEQVRNVAGDGRKLGWVEDVKQKMWSPSAFRLSLGGLNCTHVNKIDSVSVKQSVKQLHTGRSRFPEIQPTGLEFGNLSVYMALAHAKDFINWHNDFVVKGMPASSQEKSGRITYLSPDRKLELFDIDLRGVGISGFSIMESKAGQAEIKRCKVDLYVEQMDIRPGAGL